MADSEDLKLLASGELDLSRCDFREAQLSGLDLKGRNFSHCLFERAQCDGTQFDGSDFRAAKVSFMKAPNAVFDGCRLEKIHFGYTDLSGASLKKAVANGARFQHAKLNGANLQGALVIGGAIDADTILDGVLSDESTNFEGLQVIRSTSRDPLFKDYVFKNGTLHRRSDFGSSVISDSSNNERLPVDVHSPERQEIKTAKIQIQNLLHNAVVTRLTAQQFASQIENALRGVPAAQGNKVAEPLQTLLEFAEVLRHLAPDTQSPIDPLDRTQLELRIAQLETLVDRLTRQLDDETRAREAAEALAASGGFVKNFGKSAGKASGTAAVAVVTSLVTIGVPAATVFLLGREHPLVVAFLTVLGRLPK
ncbi:Serine/threonine-protein kinase B [Hartmannibacter diazotrophicus]|uniref:Serine/threonine-protein kinase B n=1 Tax=Hartmannibacter diazotrophicus TaxID=1482074 RepID=A0A2C9D9Z4_9HYPH|nr:pentapeptide repeat-containing protein [Hartmannibacter diazotrophicus]SON56990.1 Serine/threonine-protein kinase B [Hartmannibacter diazotrophicus]